MLQNLSWDSLHPMVVHFPIALMLLAPFAVVGALVFRRHARVLIVCTVILMAIGTVGAFMASSTGEAAAEIAEETYKQHEAAIETHEEMAESLWIVFLALTLFLAILAGGWRRLEKHTILAPAALATFILLSAGADVFLIRAAHSGGQLVHELGVHSTPIQTNQGNQLPRKQDDHD